MGRIFMTSRFLQQWLAPITAMVMALYPIPPAAKDADTTDRIHPEMTYLMSIAADDMFVIPYVNGAPLFRHLRLENVLTTVDITGEMKPGENEIAVDFEPFDRQARAFIPHEGVKLQIRISGSTNPMLSPRVQEEITLFSGQYDAETGEIRAMDQSVYGQGPSVSQDGKLRGGATFRLEPVVMEYTEGRSREYARRLVLTFDIGDVAMPVPPWIDALPLSDTPRLRRDLAAGYAKLHAAISAGDLGRIAEAGDAMLVHEANVLGYATPLEVVIAINAARPWTERDGARLAPLPADLGRSLTRLDFATDGRLISGWTSPLDYLRPDGSSIGQLVYWFCRPDGGELVPCYSQDPR